MLAIITGISGQDGAFLAEELLNNGIRVSGVVSNSKSSLNGLKYLEKHNAIEIRIRY